LLREPSRLKRQIVLPVFAFDVVLTRLGIRKKAEGEKVRKGWMVGRMDDHKGG